MSSPFPITAVEVCNALGESKIAVEQALQAAQSGLRKEMWRDEPAVVGRCSSTLPALPAKFADYDTRLARLALAVATSLQKPVNQAIARWGRERIGLLMGTSTGGIGATEQAYRHWLAHDRLPPSFHWERTHAMHGALRVVAEVMNVQGPRYVVSTACSSSSKIFASASRLLNMGVCDSVLVGGVDCLCELTYSGFKSLGLLSSEPCQPFGQRRQGINLGEGAAWLLLEREGESEVRLLGVGESSDAYHMTSPHPQGLGAQLAMERALQNANLDSSQITHIYAHATGTQQNDFIESQAIVRVFGEKTPVVATKGYTGHLLGAAGVAEIAHCIFTLQSGYLPASVGAIPLDPVIAAHVVHEACSWPTKIAMVNSFAFGGSNASVLLGANE